MAYDILDEPFIETVLGQQPRLVTLPGLFAAWGSGGHDLVLDGMRPHQRPAMHMFLCQTAAAAAQRADSADLTVGAEEWHQRLLAIAPSSAWHLVGDRDEDAAFLQPPVTKEIAADFKSASSPDDLTVLVLAKNHIMKQSRMGQAEPWAWICALVELQTMSGYGGAKNYGVARMNGGCGSRPLVAIYPDMRDGARWSRDVTVLLEQPDAIRNKVDGFAPRGQGIVATWTEPWDGAAQLQVSQLDPLCVEVCRRLRLRQKGGRLTAVVGNSTDARIGGTDRMQGKLGDPWGPLDGNGEKLLTLAEDGWTTHKLRELIVPGAKCAFRISLLQQPRASETGPLFFHAAVTVGGNGKTGGFHEVTVPIPGNKVFSIFGEPEGRDHIGRTATRMAEDGDNAGKALRAGVFRFCQGQKPARDLKWDAREPSAWVSQVGPTLHGRVRATFFEHLWKADDANGDTSAWREWLRTETVKIFDNAISAMPYRQECFFQAEASARGMLMASLNRAFPMPHKPMIEEAAQ
jgi:CRISPR system Cascade subunit CasA